MTENEPPLTAGLAAAGAEISRVARDEIAPAARLIEEAFAGAARAIERDLVRAARAGELSLKGLSRAILNDLKRAAIDSFIRKPVENLLFSALSGAFGGGRAAGGFVAAGQSYLVGERGPELFTPQSSGRIGGAGGGAVNVSITLPGVTDPASFRNSETQIAASLARVIARGARNQ
ncbi:MAG: phage tail tape measure C-terminal domain-containing protein [Parvularculaceae bacterium]|nr:phage tail tape measure C-terminal domain-containing protein [Parvularculaceae bacterium]